MIKQILMGSNYWVLNKSVVKELGLETAFMLSNLAEADSMMANEDGWFYQTSDTLEIITGFKKDKQTKLLRRLIKLGILVQKNRGIPQKRYFKLDYKSIELIVYGKTANLSTKKPQTNLLESRNNKESIDKESIIKKPIVRLDKSDETFEEFWNTYNKKQGRKKCLSKWKRLTLKDRVAIMKFLPSYIKATPDIKYRQHPYTFLNSETWNDELNVGKVNLGQNGKGFEKPKGKVAVGMGRDGKLIYE